MENEEDVNFIGGAKNALQELCAKLGMKEKEMPDYVDVVETGMPHCKLFTVQCVVGGNGISALGIASNKKQAGKLAAAKVLKQMEHLKPKSERDSKTVMSILMFDKADSIINSVKGILDITRANECIVLLDDGLVYEGDYAIISDRSLQLMFESGMTDLSAWERIIKCIKASSKASDLVCNYNQGDGVITFKRVNGHIKFDYVYPLHYDEVIKLHYGDTFSVEEDGEKINHVRCCKEDGKFSYDVLNTNLCQLRDERLNSNNIRRVLYVHDPIHDDVDVDSKLRKLMYSIFINCNYSFKAMDSRLNHDHDQRCEIEPTVVEYA